MVVPFPNKEAATVARAFVESFVLVYGIPECIATDCGTEFLADIFKDIELYTKDSKLSLSKISIPKEEFLMLILSACH
jgi:hypothetical protein